MTLSFTTWPQFLVFQARALKELATRLFHALKTDPENFETEASIQRLGLSGRTKAGARTLNKTNPSIAARGRSCNQLWLSSSFFLY